LLALDLLVNGHRRLLARKLAPLQERVLGERESTFEAGVRAVVKQDEACFAIDFFESGLGSPRLVCARQGVNQLLARLFEADRNNARRGREFAESLEQAKDIATD